MTFEDLKRCLILLSYDTVRPEDESQTCHNVLPYTFEDDCIILMPALKSPNAQTAAWQESRSFIICSDFNYNKIVGSYFY